MEQEQRNFWLSAVYDSAGYAVEELARLKNLSSIQRAKADLLFRQYLYDRLPGEIERADEVRREVVEMMCEEIYPSLMEEVLYRNWSDEENLALATFLHACTGGVREDPVFGDLLHSVLETDISDQELRSLKASADCGLDRFVEQRVAGGRTREFCGSLEYWSEAEAFFQDSSEEALACVLDAAIQTLAQLRALHERDLLHTDVSPENMHLYSDGTVELVNAGTYRRGGCTPAYAAPEKMGEHVGSLRLDELPASDLYSWALSTVQLMVGERLWLYGQDLASPWYRSGNDLLETVLSYSRVKKVDLLHQLLRKYLCDDPKERPHRISDETELDTMLTKIYESELRTEYKAGEALGAFIRPRSS